MSRTLLLVLLSAGALTRASHAQDAAAWRDSLVHIGTEIAALRDSLVDRDSTVVEIARNGGLVLSATPADKAAAARAFQYFLMERDRWFGNAVPAPNGFRLVMQILPEHNIFTKLGSLRTEGRLVLTGLPDTADAVRIQRAATVKDLGVQLLTGFSEMMFLTLGGATTQWLGNSPPFQMSERERRGLAMYMIMTSTGKAGRGCISGDFAACAYSLGLRTAPSSDLTDAFPTMVRADLFLTALEIGGAGAWSRIAAARPARAEEALTLASGLSPDSLLTQWRAGILSLKPDVGPMRPGSALLAAGWVGVLLLGTLGASRWR